MAHSPNLHRHSPLRGESDLPKWKQSQELLTTQKETKTSQLQHFFQTQLTAQTKEDKSKFHFVTEDLPRLVHTKKFTELFEEKYSKYGKEHYGYKENLNQMKKVQSSTKRMQTADILLFLQRSIEDAGFQIQVQNMFVSNLKEYKAFLGTY